MTTFHRPPPTLKKMGLAAFKIPAINTWPVFWEGLVPVLKGVASAAGFIGDKGTARGRLDHERGGGHREQSNDPKVQRHLQHWLLCAMLPTS